jgi:hypothetical protein
MSSRDADPGAYARAVRRRIWIAGALIVGGCAAFGSSGGIDAGTITDDAGARNDGGVSGGDDAGKVQESGATGDAAVDGNDGSVVVTPPCFPPCQSGWCCCARSGGTPECVQTSDLCGQVGGTCR